MNTHTTSRRGALGALGVGASLLAGVPAVMAARAEATTHDPKWLSLLGAYEDAKARHHAAIDRLAEAELASRSAVEAFRADPVKPRAALPDDLTSLTLEEILAASDDPSYKQAWNKYEADMAAWKAEKAALPETIHEASMDTATHAAARAEVAAFGAVVAHRASSLAVLREKLELIEATFRGDMIEYEHLNEILADVRHLSAQVQA